MQLFSPIFRKASGRGRVGMGRGASSLPLAECLFCEPHTLSLGFSHSTEDIKKLCMCVCVCVCVCVFGCSSTGVSFGLDPLWACYCTPSFFFFFFFFILGPPSS